MRKFNPWCMLTDNSYTFSWKDIGDIKLGRPNLGDYTTVAVYRLMQYSLRNVLNKTVGAEEARKIFFEAGRISGIEFCKNILNKNLVFTILWRSCRSSYAS
jgi:uncharacterized protein